MGKVFNALKRAEESAEEERYETNTVAVESRPKQESIAISRLQPQPKINEPLEPAMRPGQWDDRLILSAATTGAVAESIRALRTRILYPASGTIPRTILVTSASPGEGKSFICANLGISLAQGVDNYCLLVDCDLRRPSQHNLFGLGNNVGLADYLQRQRELSEIIIPSGIEKLSILPAGRRSVNPAELLGSAAMIRLVDELAMRYDDRIVLLDSPPLHSASETSVLAQHVDGVILVVRYGASRREYIKALTDTVGRDKILGVVFNAYKATMLDYKVFGYYEYQHKYYYGEK